MHCLFVGWIDFHSHADRLRAERPQFVLQLSIYGLESKWAFSPASFSLVAYTKRCCLILQKRKTASLTLTVDKPNKRYDTVHRIISELSQICQLVSSARDDTFLHFIAITNITTQPYLEICSSHVSGVFLLDTVLTNFSHSAITVLAFAVSYMMLAE